MKWHKFFGIACMVCGVLAMYTAKVHK